MPQKHIFCSLAQFLFDLEHFSFMFPRQEEEEEQQQQSSFKDLWALLAVKKQQKVMLIIFTYFDIKTLSINTDFICYKMPIYPKCMRNVSLHKNSLMARLGWCFIKQAKNVRYPTRQKFGSMSARKVNASRLKVTQFAIVCSRRYGY